MSKMLQIRREYGEPFIEVVKGFAEMGYSRSLTASVLGINLSYFRQLCTRFDLHRHFRKQADMRRECKGGGKGWPKGVGRISNRAPLTIDGITYYPGEPAHHCAWEKLSARQRRKASAGKGCAQLSGKPWGMPTSKGGRE